MHTDSKFWAIATPTRPGRYRKPDPEVMDARLHEAAGINGLTEVMAELLEQDEARAACMARHPAGKDLKTDAAEDVRKGWTYSMERYGVPSKDPENPRTRRRLTIERDQARDIAVALEQRLAACRDLADQWDGEADWWEGSPALGQTIDPAKVARAYTRALRAALDPT